MKKHLLTLIAIVVALAVLGASEASAEQSLKSKLIKIDAHAGQNNNSEKCMDNKDSMADCRSFIKGFLQGAVLTDTAIIESIGMTESSFAERALRTRLGKRSSSPTELAGFCLPNDRSILDLAEETLDHVKASTRNSAELAKNVYSSLKVDYPCK